MSENTQVNIAEVLAVDDVVMRETGSREYGVTRGGFIAKSFARLLTEKIALAQSLLGSDIDLTSGSVLRKLLEITALEDARTWATLAHIYDNNYVTSATGVALTHLGTEIGIERPQKLARGEIKLTLSGELPTGYDHLTIPRGARLLTDGGHHVATDERVVLSPSSPERTVAVAAFYPGDSHNLDPAEPTQIINQWNRSDVMLTELNDAEEDAGAPLITITHSKPLTGGEVYWSDARYRNLLLRAPRSIWTVEAMELAVSLVPGVRQVQIRDGLGGLDIYQSIFGNFNFLERVFGTERDLGNPYYFTVLVAPTPAAIWEGTEGLRAAIESALEDLRPISIFPRIERAEEIGVGVEAELIVRGVPLPSGTRATVNASEPAQLLKERLLDRIRRYVDSLSFGEPVRASEVIWAIMNEPGVTDVRNLRLLRYPPGFEAVDLSDGVEDVLPEALDCGVNLDLAINQIPTFVDASSGMVII
jgi:hypothetical protein